MRMLMNVRIPHEPFNSAVRKGTAAQIIKHILEEIKPEEVYFTEQNGTWAAVIIINVNDPSEIPSFSGPWSLNFNAHCEFRILMTPGDLDRAGLDELGRKWK
jgi:hypothetical protein